MSAPAPVALMRQHLIDPEVCIRCNTCEETCPVHAITHDGRNYVVNAAICEGCNACIAPCPTGSIDHWRVVPKASPYTLQEQLGWDELPIEREFAADALAPATVPMQVNAARSRSSSVPPKSAARAEVNLFTLKKPVTATVAGNLRLTADGAEADIRHIVLDFGSHRFPVLEGQAIGVVAPGVDAGGKPHFPRMYSVASPRTGEREGYNNLALTVKRVTVGDDGKPWRGVASNYLCDLKKGDTVVVVGPFGETFLMPDHDGANLLMICTGTGSAPMRAMTEHRRRLLAGDKPNAGKLMLFFGARRPEELPYFGPLARLPASFIITHLAFSRIPGQPRTYVQDRMREHALDVAELLRGDTCVYICGLRGMEDGVLQALEEACVRAGMDWSALYARLVDEGRFHVETY